MRNFLIWFFVLFAQIESARILVWPAEWSHWINMKVIIKELVARDHDVTVMRSYAYTDFIKNDMPDVNYFDFYVPYEPGSHLESMDKVLYSIKLGNQEEISTIGKATAMVGFWYEQGKF
jgi:glucuronosyltransferase